MSGEACNLENEGCDTCLIRTLPEEQWSTWFSVVKSAMRGIEIHGVEHSTVGGWYELADSLPECAAAKSCLDHQLEIANLAIQSGE